MPAIDDDDRPKKKIAHEIGQELALLSVGELQRADRAAAGRDRAAGGGHRQQEASRDGRRPVLQEMTDARCIRGMQSLRFHAKVLI